MAGDRARLLKRAGFGGNEPLQMDSVLRRPLRHPIQTRSSSTSRTTKPAMPAAPPGLWSSPSMALRSLMPHASRRRHVLACASGCPCSRRARRCSSWAKRSERRSRYTFDNFLVEPRRHSRRADRERSRRSFAFYQDLITSQPPVALDPQPQHRHPPPVEPQSQSLPLSGGAETRKSLSSPVSTTTPSLNGYVIEKDLLAIPDAGWKEIFNSDAAIYGGQNIGNRGATIRSNQGRLNVAIPANGFVLLVKQ